MVHAGRRVSLLAAVAVLGAGVPAVVGSAAQAAPAMGRAASVRSVPRINGQLEGVSADSATDAWAVGYYLNSSNIGQPVTMQWNGTTWSQVTSPSPHGYAQLSGVGTVPGAGAWAAGTSFGPKNLAWSALVSSEGGRWALCPPPVVVDVPFDRHGVALRRRLAGPGGVGVALAPR